MTQYTLRLKCHSTYNADDFDQATKPTRLPDSDMVELTLSDQDLQLWLRAFNTSTYMRLHYMVSKVTAITSEEG